MYNFNKQQKGLSLIELMIAMTLGVIVILGATTSLSTMISSSRVQMGNSDMQQTADTALSYIGSRLRNALSTPCDQLSVLNRLEKLNISKLEGDVAGENISDTQAPEIENLLLGRGISIRQGERSFAGNSNVKTDIITIASLNDRVLLAGDTDMELPKIALQDVFPSDSTAGKTLYAVTNCDSMDIFRGELSNKAITPAWNTDPDKPETSFRENYREVESSMVTRVQISEIEINDEGELLNKAIFDSGDGTALMDDVELLRVLFAIDNKGDDGVADKYVSAGELGSIDSTKKIISAELFLVVKNGDPDNSAVPAGYKIRVPKTDGTTLKGDIYADNNVDELTFNDRVMRKLFIRTVTFRNGTSL